MFRGKTRANVPDVKTAQETNYDPIKVNIFMMMVVWLFSGIVEIFPGSEEGRGKRYEWMFFFLLQARGKDLRYLLRYHSFCLFLAFVEPCLLVFLMDSHWPWYDGPWCHAPEMCVIFLLSRIPALQRWFMCSLKILWLAGRFMTSRACLPVAPSSNKKFHGRKSLKKGDGLFRIV